MINPSLKSLDSLVPCPYPNLIPGEVASLEESFGPGCHLPKMLRDIRHEMDLLHRELSADLRAQNQLDAEIAELKRTSDDFSYKAS